MQASEQKAPDILYTLIKIGAILIIIDAALRLVIVGIVGSLANSAVFSTGLFFSISGTLAGILILLSLLFIAGIVFGALIIVQTDRMKRNPEEGTHSVYILVMAVIAFLAGGGFEVGSVIIIGCVVIILILGASFSMNLSSMVGKRICPNCGLVSNGNANFCPSCGKKFQ